MAVEIFEGVYQAYQGYGRTAPPPVGKIFVRDPAAASARAVRDAVERFEAAGEEVPKHLARLAAGLGEDSPVYVEVDSDFPPEAGRYFELVVPEDLRSDSEREADEQAAAARAELAARPEPEPEPVAEPVAEPEPVVVDEEVDADEPEPVVVRLPSAKLAEGSLSGSLEPVSENGHPADSGSSLDLEEFTVAELKAELDRQRIAYDPRARKPELIDLVKNSEG